MLVTTLYVKLLQTAFITKCHEAHVVWGKRKAKENTENVQNNQT